MTKKPPEIERPPFWMVDDENQFQGHGKPMEIDTVMLIFNLENDALYTATEAVATRYPRKHPLYKSVFHRLCTFLSATWLTQRPDETRPKCKKENRTKPIKSVKQSKTRSVDRSLIRRWYGATLKNQLSDKNYYRAQILSTLPGLFKQVALKETQEKKAAPSIPIAEVKKTNPNKKRRIRSAPSLKITHQDRRRTGAWLLLAAAVCVLLFSALTPALVRSSERVYEILRTQGSKKALAYVISNHEQGITAYYKSAWIDYRNNFFERAEQKAYVILSDKNTPVKVQADCYYLLGEIKAVTGGSRESIGSLLDAYRLYEQEERDANLYYCSLVMAKAYVGLGKFDEAKGMLDQALIHQSREREGKIRHLGNYYIERIRYCMRLGEFEEALEASQQEAIIFEEINDRDNLAGAYSNLGFWYAINGNLDMGWVYTVRAQNLIYQLEDDRRNTYNLVNFVLLQRLSGLSPEKRALDSINNWIKVHNDKELSYHIRFALSYTPETKRLLQSQN